MNEKNCAKGVTIVQIPDECNGGNFLSTSCVQTPNAISYLDLPAGSNQTQINAALVSSLIYKDQEIDNIEAGQTAIIAGDNIILEGDGSGATPYIISSSIDTSGLVDLISDQSIDGEKSFLNPVSGVIATEPQHLTTLSQLIENNTTILEEANSYTDANTSTKLDKGTYNGTAQTLKDEIDNIYQPDTLLSSVPPTRVGNTFTYPLNGYSALINKTVRTNTNEFQTVIGAATDNYKRVDLVYFKSDNTLDKVIGTESLTVAARPDIPNGVIGVPVSFINVFGSTIETPTPITQEISIQDSLGIEKFKVNDYLRFDGVSMHPSQKLISIDPLVPLSAFLDPLNGNDITGALENSKKPFKTIEALLTALPSTTGETYTIYITGGIVPVLRKITIRNLKFIAYRDTTLDFTNCMENDGLTHALECLTYAGNTGIWYFENENISVVNYYVGRKELAADRSVSSLSNVKGLIFKGTINILNWTSTSIQTFNPPPGLPMREGTSIVIKKLYDSSQRCSVLSTYGNCNIVINEFIASRRNFLIFPDLDNTILDVKKISEAVINSNTLALRGTNIKIGDVNLTGTLQINASKYLDFNGTLSTNCVLDLKSAIVRGFIDSTTYCTTDWGGSIMRFENFTGKLNALVGAGGKFIFNNCTIEVKDYLVHKFVGRQDILFFEGFNSITQINTSVNLVKNHPAQPNVDPLVILEERGQISTNMLSFGENVTHLKRTATFKEKSNEVVIRSKKDLVNKTLSSETNYIIDGVINDLLPSDRIIVPVGGLSLSGYGFDVSAIKALQANSIIFSSPVGGCGNLFLSNISLEASGGGSKVFQLTNAGAPTGGADAIELNVVNFENCDSLGELTNFRQGLWDNIGVFSVKDGLTLSGTWSGGFRSDLTIVRNFGIAATVSTLFKAGTDLLFKSRFWTDINADFKAAGSLSNFDAVNFATSNLYQIKGAQVTRGGIIDDAQNYTGTITAFDVVSDWQGNNGIPNSNLHPYGITTDKMDVFANDVDAASGGVQVGQVYIESATGYFKTRLT